MLKERLDRFDGALEVYILKRVFYEHYSLDST